MYAFKTWINETFIVILSTVITICSHWLELLRKPNNEKLPLVSIDEIIGKSFYSWAIVDTDLDKNTGLKYLYVSDPWLELFDLQGIDVVGKSHYQLVEDVPKKWKEDHRRCILDEVPLCIINPENVTINQKECFLLFQLRPLFDYKKKVVAMAMEYIDVTDSMKNLRQLKTVEKTSHILLATIAHQIKSRCRSLLLVLEENRYDLIGEQLRILIDITDSLIQLGAAGNSNCNDTLSLKNVLVQAIKSQRIESCVLLNVEDFMFEGSKKLMIDLFEELFINANKYKRDILSIEINGYYNNRYKTEYTLDIKDYGIGIEDKKLSLVTTPFFRVYKGNDNGSGLGLTYVQLVAEKHNILFSIKSVLGQYTIVKLVFKNIKIYA